MGAGERADITCCSVRSESHRLVLPAGSRRGYAAVVVRRRRLTR